MAAWLLSVLFLAGAACTADSEPAQPTGTAPDRSPTSQTSAAQPGGAPAATPALQRMATLDQPVFLTTRANDDAIYIAEKRGRIRRLTVGADRASVVATVLDISDRVSTGGEQGLLGMAFAPDGTKLYASYTNTSGDSRIVEYPFTGGTANAQAAREVLAVDQPYANHNGGQISFGPDGMLYIALGDGGSGGDPENRAQNLGTLLGKILRIDPTPKGAAPYTVPAGNPFVGQSGTRPEIWHYGLRNPWRFSFDRANGEQWIADVGQNAWEEVNHVASRRGGLNFGWRPREGNHAFNGGDKPEGAVDPVYELSHDDGNCSITGGYVYRGAAIAGFAGNYVFADYCRGRILARAGTSVRDLGLEVGQLTSFGEDHGGELWVLSLSGDVFRLVSA